MSNIIEKITGPLDVTLALGVACYVIGYGALKIAVEVYGFANPILAATEAARQNERELADLARAQIQAQVDHAVALFAQEYGEEHGR